MKNKMKFDELKLTTKIKYTKESILSLKRQIINEATSEIPTLIVIKDLGNKLKEKRALLRELELEKEWSR